MTRRGEQIPAETRVTTGRWYGKNVLFGFSRDIRRQIHAEEEVRNSEARLRTLLNAAMGLSTMGHRAELLGAALS